VLLGRRKRIFAESLALREKRIVSGEKQDSRQSGVRKPDYFCAGH
jgi:hypothetical protein